LLLLPLNEDACRAAEVAAKGEADAARIPAPKADRACLKLSPPPVAVADDTIISAAARCSGVVRKVGRHMVRRVGWSEQKQKAEKSPSEPRGRD